MGFIKPAGSFKADAKFPCNECNEGWARSECDEGCGRSGPEDDDFDGLCRDCHGTGEVYCDCRQAPAVVAQVGALWCAACAAEDDAGHTEAA